MPEYTAHWFDGARDNFQNHLLPRFNNSTKNRFLEIGSFEGLSSNWLVDNCLKHEGSSLLCIDSFDGGYELSDNIVSGLHKRFLRNTEPHLKSGKISVLHGKSEEMLMRLRNTVWENTFDFIYIDGSHLSFDVLTDAILSFPLLKVGGLLIFDDYGGGGFSPHTVPGVGIDCFLKCYQDFYEVVFSNYQKGIRKTDTPENKFRKNK